MSGAPGSIPWHAWVLLIRPERVRAHLEAQHAAGLLPEIPSLWQIELGVLRMWHRVIFRPQSIGTSRELPVRATRRARLLAFRPLRFFPLVWERAVAPLDHSGLGQPSWRLVRHLLAAHHDRNQFAYDLQILRADPARLAEVETRAREVVEQDTPRSRWLRDLVVFEHYHEHLLAAVGRARRGEALVDAQERDDPDIDFYAYIRWCLAQPATPGATWRAWRGGMFPTKPA